jgi:hypothetical protein
MSETNNPFNQQSEVRKAAVSHVAQPGVDTYLDSQGRQHTGDDA